MNDPSQQHIGTPALIRRFAPYLMRYKRILIFDLSLEYLIKLITSRRLVWNFSRSSSVRVAGWIR